MARTLVRLVLLTAVALAVAVPSHAQARSDAVAREAKI